MWAANLSKSRTLYHPVSTDFVYIFVYIAGGACSPRVEDQVYSSLLPGDFSVLVFLFFCY